MKESMKKARGAVYLVYTGVGVVAMGLLACCVIFSVIARYAFSLSWKQLEEFMITLFAFSTFWGLGFCVLENEHVVVDVLYSSLKPALKRVMSIINCVIMLVVNLLFFYHSLNYVGQVGHQISHGIGIPMKFMYGVMPVSLGICAVCIVLKIINNIMLPASAFAPRQTVKE